jgi:Cu/Ag efflux protein CusF
MLALFLSAAVFAKTKKTEEKQLTPTTHVESQTTEITAKVKSINYDDRHVVLVGPAGNEVTVKVSEDVKNFKQIKKGDEVNVNYNESLVWFIRKKGEKVTPTKGVTTEASTAAVGQKPALDKSKTLDLIATIEAIDPKTPAVTLKGPEGNTMTIRVQDPENLKGVKVGDQVDITYTESIAVNVEKAKKK